MASTKWETLKDLRQRNVDNAQALLLETEKRKQEAVQSLNQVLIYIKEYREKIKAEEKGTASAANLSRSRRFLQQLINTSVQQENLCIKLSHQADQDQAELMRRRADLKAIEKLDEKDKRVERQITTKREVKDLDELSRSRFLGNLHHRDGASKI